MKPFETPAGFWLDAKGNLVAEANIKPIDLLRTEMVEGIVQEGVRCAKMLAEYKTSTLDEIAEFIELAAMEHGIDIGGKKGNASFISFDGRYKVTRANADNITFNEQLLAAKALIDECLTEWTKDSSDNIKTIVGKAFEMNKAGEISTARVLGLRSLDIDDEKWRRAMEAISCAITIVGSKTYLRIYERNEDTGEYHQISLNSSDPVRATQESTAPEVSPC